MDPQASARSSLPLLPTDQEVVRRVLGGEVELYELIMRRHNQRLYRAIRSLIRDEAEVEDVMQQAYVSAYLNLGKFQGGSQLSTWLTRIAINEALMRLRRSRKLVALDGGNSEEAPMTDSAAPPPRSPEDLAAGRELLGLLEREVDGLPDLYRTAFVLRDVEGLSTAEAATALEISEEVVKTRLHRARLMLRERITSVVGARQAELFAFHAPRCDRVVHAVMSRVATLR